MTGYDVHHRGVNTHEKTSEQSPFLEYDETEKSKANRAIGMITDSDYAGPSRSQVT